MKDEKSILQEAHSIVNERNEDKDRRYGSFDDCMGRVSKLATILTGKDITTEDAYWVLVCLKLSRESHYHKRDNMVDMVGYLQGLHSFREKNLQTEDKLSEEALEKRMNIIGQNGNTGEHYDNVDGEGPAMFREVGSHYDGISVKVAVPNETPDGWDNTKENGK